MCMPGHRPHCEQRGPRLTRLALSQLAGAGPGAGEDSLVCRGPFWALNFPFLMGSPFSEFTVEPEFLLLCECVCVCVCLCAGAY